MGGQASKHLKHRFLPFAYKDDRCAVSNYIAQPPSSEDTHASPEYYNPKNFENTYTIFHDSQGGGATYHNNVRKSKSEELHKHSVKPSKRSRAPTIFEDNNAYLLFMKEQQRHTIHQ